MEKIFFTKDIFKYFRVRIYITMSNTFNLNIDDYDINELKDLLNLRDPYSLQEIVKNEDELREKLLLDKQVTLTKKKEIIKFLEDVKDRLIENSKEQFKNIESDEIISNNHSIVARKNSVVDVINSVDKNYMGDSVNKHTIHKLISIDSRFRDNYYNTLSTDYNLTLPTNIKNVVSMELAALEMPTTYFQISKSKGNNFFWIKKAHNWHYINIPDGNYKRQSMENIINTNLSQHTDTSNIVFKIDENSTKSVFCDTSMSEITIYFNRDNNNQSDTAVTTEEPDLNLKGYNGIIGNFGWLLGFRMGSYSGSNTYISEGCYDAWGTKYLYIIVNDFNKNVNNFCIPSYNESMGKTNILARISTSAISSQNFSDGLSLTNETVSNDASIRKRHYFGPVNISKLEIQIVDELGRVIDLNNMDFSFSLNLICLYD